MPAPTELVRQSLAPLGSPILPGGRTGNQALDVLAALVERLDSRLASMEARLATPPTPPDPLADVQRTLAMAKAFGQLRDTFASGRDDRDDDDDDDDDDEEPEAPGLEGVAMRFVESKLREMEKETGAADVAPANPRPHVQPSSPAPSARPRAPAPMPPRAQPTPAAATAAARAVVVDVDPYATPAVEQGWGTVVEIGREQERPAEREPAGDVDADAIIRTIERLPSDEALDLIAEAVSRLPRDKLLDFVQRMQAKEE